jgi:hypothetical protein
VQVARKNKRNPENAQNYYSVREYGPVPYRPRVTLDVAPDVDAALTSISKEKGSTRAEITRLALTAYFENMGYESSFAREDVGGEKLVRRVHVRSAKQVLFHSELLIHAFQEALDYDPGRHHNHPPPALRLEDKEYLDELRRLVSELKQLNQFLSQLKTSKKRAPTTAQKHLNTFLNKYAGTLGTGAGIMSLGVIATLIYQLGAGEVVFDHLLKKLPGR